MGKRLMKRKRFTVDEQAYQVSISVNVEEVPQLCVTIRADYGKRSCCIIRGLKNYNCFWNYGEYNKEDFSEMRDTIEVTPKMIAALIQHAKEQGWSPDTSKSNFNLEMTNTQAKALLA
jgi:hypothetical protein